MRRLILLLAESSLETVPPEIQNHPAIIKDAQRRGVDPRYLILDRARHHPAMERLPKGEKRGRPDIVHQALLTIQDSMLAKKGLVKTYIHTLRDVLIDVDPEIRPPRNYNNFIGLMSQLFKFGRVPPVGKALMRVIGSGIDPVIELEKPDVKVLLDDVRGRDTTFSDLTRFLTQFERPLVIIGAFPHGAFEDSTYSYADAIYKVASGHKFETSSLLCRLLALLEYKLGLLK